MKKQEKKQPTIREVAKLAHVGVMTVSRVINDHPSVRLHTRKRVEAAIVQLGYKQNEAARLLKGRRAKMIGLIVPDLSDIFFASCAHTVQHLARANGYMTLVVSSERDAELEVQQAELMASRMISGLLIVTSTKKGDERLRNLQSTGLPIVGFDRPLPGLETDAVLVENRAGAEEAVRHLIGHGHKRIACIGYDEDVYTVHERIQGYRNQMQSSHLKADISLGEITLDSIRQWVATAMTKKDRPTAIFALNHRTSSFLLQALAEKKIKVPEEMALLGFDDFDLASVVTPPLTTVAQSPVDLARRAMALLMERIQNDKAGTETVPAKIMLPTRLIIRKSCGPHREKEIAV
jgi:LacI family transcriptional regulator